MDGLEKSLRAVGLSEKEVAIYLAILQTGKISLADIAKRTHINRTTLYHSVDELLQRGLISKTIRGKRTLYVPEDPDKILKDFDKRRSAFLAHVPQIEEIYKNAMHKPGVRLYEGLDGITQILHEI